MLRRLFNLLERTGEYAQQLQGIIWVAGLLATVIGLAISAFNINFTQFFQQPVNDFVVNLLAGVAAGFLGGISALLYDFLFRRRERAEENSPTNEQESQIIHDVTREIDNFLPKSEIL